jgi:hypothetical protein
VDGLEPLVREIRDGDRLRARRLVEIPNEIRTPIARADHSNT